ncbi:MAG: sigma-70 family RNA polymerase sigma factor [Pedobacter sp.]
MGRKTKISLTEPELIQAIQNKDKIGAEALYDMYSASLYGVIFRIVQREEIAEDLLQDTFVRIWNSFSSYDPSKGKLFTWMVNIARNIAIDKTRSKDFRNGLKTEDIDNNVLSIEGNFQSEMNTETLGIKELVEKLKPDHKLVLDLVYYKGYTHVEVAEQLEIPLGTVKTRLRNAIITLRKVFN